MVIAETACMWAVKLHSDVIVADMFEYMARYFIRKVISLDLGIDCISEDPVTVHIMYIMKRSMRHTNKLSGKYTVFLNFFDLLGYGSDWPRPSSTHHTNFKGTSRKLRKLIFDMQPQSWNKPFNLSYIHYLLMI